MSAGYVRMGFWGSLAATGPLWMAPMERSPLNGGAQSACPPTVDGWHAEAVTAPVSSDHPFSSTAMNYMSPVCNRRLTKLETFEGDPDIGYAKPDGRAVSAVRQMMSAIYCHNPEIESPLISPSVDGEILVSWRRNGRYFVLHFDSGSKFEWSFKFNRLLDGVADAKD